jgi:lipoyl(octanoyl) transferase
MDRAWIYSQIRYHSSSSGSPLIRRYAITILTFTDRFSIPFVLRRRARERGGWRPKVKHYYDARVKKTGLPGGRHSGHNAYFCAMEHRGKGLVQIVDLGLIPYKEAWDLQTAIHQHLIENKRAGYPAPQHHYLLLCEHPPVFTLGKSGSEDNLKINDRQLKDFEIEFFKINRGGDITFHGPGQVVGYPILDLDLIFTDVHKYVRGLEEVIIRVLKEYGIEAFRNDRYTGVWVDSSKGMMQTQKICAIGVHLSRWVSMHGFAFNINTNLDYFNHIIPCGIQDADKSVCSLSSLLNRKVDIQEVKQRIAVVFGDVFDIETQDMSMSLLQDVMAQNNWI